MSESPRRVGSLYVCYLSLDDPLVHTQVVAYLRGLAAVGHRIHLLTFETSRLTLARRRYLRALMEEHGIVWHGLRYHRRPSLPATAWDALAGAALSAVVLRRYRLDLVHARAHVPAAMALIVSGLLRRRPPALLFDIRGLMAEEYEDAGRWRRDGVPFRLTKVVERVSIRRAAGIVVLTETLRTQLFGDHPPDHVRVIPCCADLAALEAASSQRGTLRGGLGVSRATVMVYVGKFGGWYMADEMAEFFTVARDVIPHLHFLILTQTDGRLIREALGRHRVGQAEATIVFAPPEHVGGYLAAADFGISFIRPAPSKASSSPTKIGEYLGAGLPILATAGVGDLDRVLGPEVAVLVKNHSRRAYHDAATAVLRLLGADTRERCLAVAERELSLSGVGVPRYIDLYADIERALREPTSLETS